SRISWASTEYGSVTNHLIATLLSTTTLSSIIVPGLLGHPLYSLGTRHRWQRDAHGGHRYVPRPLDGGAAHPRWLARPPAIAQYCCSRVRARFAPDGHRVYRES